MGFGLTWPSNSCFHRSQSVITTLCWCLCCSCCPRGWVGCVPCCVSGSDGWESSLTGFTLVLLHPSSSPGTSNQICIKKMDQKVKKSWILLLTWFPRQIKAPVPVKWWVYGCSGSAHPPWQSLAIGDQISDQFSQLLPLYWRKSSPSLLGTYKGPENSSGKNFPVFFFSYPLCSHKASFCIQTHFTPPVKVWILRMRIRLKWKGKACKSFFITEIQKTNVLKCLSVN